MNERRSVRQGWVMHAGQAMTKTKEPANGNQTGRWNGIVRIVGFFCLVAACSMALDLMFSLGLRRIRTSSFGVTNRVLQGKVNADLVISGSSRAVTHYDPRIIQKITGLTVFNLGRNGSQTDMQLAVLKTYLRHNKKPQMVVQNLDAYSFVTTREVYDPAQYLPYLDQEDIYGALKAINPAIWKSKYIPLYGYVAEDMRFTWVTGLKGFLGWSPQEDHFLGFNPRSGKWSQDFDRFRAKNPQGVRIEIEPAGVRVVEELIRVCRQSGIRLVFVYSPEYREMQLLTRNRDEIFDEFHQLSYRFEVPLLDFSGWDHSLDREFFQNSQHLNAEGAAAFSLDVAKQLGDLLSKPAVASGR